MVMAGKAVSKHRASTERMPVVGEWRNGKMTVVVPVSESVLDWLVAKKHLAEEERENSAAIKHAIESLLSARAKAAASGNATAARQPATEDETRHRR
jgi:hypothetical protein